MQDAIDIKVLQTLGMARDRPAPYGAARAALNNRSAGACPPRSADLGEKRPQPRDPGWLLRRSVHGEGQALALRYGIEGEFKAWRGTGPRLTVNEL